MLTVTIDQSEGISGADIPEQAVKKMRTGSAALSLPSPRTFFAFLFTERLFTTTSEPGTGYYQTNVLSCLQIQQNLIQSLTWLKRIERNEKKGKTNRDK